MLWAPVTRCVGPDEAIPGEELCRPIQGPDGTIGWWYIGDGVGVLSANAMSIGSVNEGKFLSWGLDGTPACYRAGWPCLAVGSTVRTVLNPTYAALRRW